MVLDTEGFVQSNLDQNLLNLAPDQAHCHLAFLVSSRERQVRMHAIYKAREVFTFVRHHLFSVPSAQSIGIEFKPKILTVILIQIFETQKWRRDPGLLIIIPGLSLRLEFFYIGSMQVIYGRAGHTYMTIYRGSNAPCTVQLKILGFSIAMCCLFHFAFYSPRPFLSSVS